MNRGTGEAFAKLAQELNRARIRATAGGGGGGRSGGGGGLPGGGFAAGGAGLAVLAVGAIVVGNYCLFNGEYLIAYCFSCHAFRCWDDRDFGGGSVFPLVVRILEEETI